MPSAAAAQLNQCQKLPAKLRGTATPYVSEPAFQAITLTCATTLHTQLSLAPSADLRSTKKPFCNMSIAPGPCSLSKAEPSERKSVVEGKRVSVRGDTGGAR